MAPVLGLLPPPCPPPFISPPTSESLLDELELELDPNLATLNFKHNPTLPTTHLDQLIHTPQTFHHLKNIHHTLHNQENHTQHTRPFHHNQKLIEAQSNSSHCPLNLLLLPLFIFLLLSTLYFLFSWTHGHEEDPSPPSGPSTYKPSYTRQPSYTLSEGVRPGSVSDWSSLYSSDDDEKEGGKGKEKLTGKELNERSSLLRKYNGDNAHVFEEEWEVERYCRMKGYGACSVERKKLEEGLREGVALLVVLD